MAVSCVNIIIFNSQKSFSLLSNTPHIIKLNFRKLKTLLECPQEWKLPKTLFFFIISAYLWGFFLFLKYMYISSLLKMIRVVLWSGCTISLIWGEKRCVSDVFDINVFVLTYFWRNTTLDATVWGKYGMLWFLSTIIFLYCRQLKVLTPQIWRHHVFRFTFYNMSNFMFLERTYFDGTPTSKIWLCGTEKLKGQLQSFDPKCLELGWEFINKIPLIILFI